MDNAQLINQDSGNVEYYTPKFIVDAARNTLGLIDLDPASNAKANEIVKAVAFLTKEQNGLDYNWHGRVWMNHPFSRGGNKLWVKKLVSEYSAGHITAACCICFASTSEEWFQPLFNYAQCWLSPRTNYYDEAGNLKRGVSKGSVVTYLGADLVAFKKSFQHYGHITTPIG